jgi:hypothetical protein
MDGRAPGRAGRQSSELREGAGVKSEWTNGRQAEESSYRSLRTVNSDQWSEKGWLRFVVSHPPDPYIEMLFSFSLMFFRRALMNSTK